MFDRKKYQREYGVLYRKNNPNYSNDWNKSHRKEKIAYQEKWAANHPEYRENFVKSHKEHLVKYAKNYSLKNKEKIKEYQKIYQLKNRGKLREYYRKRYYISPVKKLANQKRVSIKRLGGDIDISVIQQVYESNIKQFGTLTCYLCLRPIEFNQDSLEHKIPLSRGGTNAKENLDIAHRNCNSKKHNKTYEEYVKG